MRVNPAASILCAFALLGGLLQIAASIELGLAPLEKLQAAELEGSSIYIIGALATTLGLGVAWALRRRLLVAVAVLLVWQAVALWPLRGRTTSLGLAYHGEYILHHFIAFVATGAIGVVCVSWWRRNALGPARRIASVVAGGTALALLCVHVWNEPSIGEGPPAWLAEGATAAAIAAWVIAVAALWTRVEPVRHRAIAAALTLPYVLRLALSWPEGLAGASVPDGWRATVMVAMVAASLLTFVAFRPTRARPLLVLVTALSAVLTVILYIAYRHRFGMYEAGLGGLAQSLFSFTPPYPTYVARWQLLGVLIGIFAIVSAAYGGLMTPGHRARGISLALMVTAGLGLGTPALGLMVLAAGLLWIDASTEESASARVVAPPAAIEDTLARVAESLGLPAPVVLETEAGTMVAARGDIDDIAVDLRARPGRHGGTQTWDVELTVGVVGRGRAALELVPDTGPHGERPAHALGRTHRVHGSIRELESLDDALLDALVPFGSARVALWAAGSRVRFGEDLGGFEADPVTDVCRALAARE